MLHLIGMTGLLNEDQFVFLCRRHMIVQVLQELRRISVCKVIVGTDKKGSGMGQLLRLGKVAATG